MKFISKVRELRLIRQPSDRVMDDVMRRSVVLPGKKVEFFDHQFATEDPDTIDWLLSHPLFNVKFGCADDEKVWREARAKGLVPVIGGAKSTANTLNLEAVEEAPVEVNTRPEDKLLVGTDAMSLIDQKINTKIEETVSKVLEGVLGRLLSGVPALQGQEGSKKKKVFTCPVPGCEAQFESGFAVGKHKREAHSASTE